MHGWFTLQKHCNYVPWKGEWVDLVIRLGLRGYSPILQWTIRGIKEAREKHKAEVEGLPMYACINEGRLEVFPTPDKNYVVVRSNEVW